MKTNLDRVEEALEDIKNGKIVIVVDDEDRENEGDFVAAAEKVSPEMINFMAMHGRGLICTPLTETRCNELKLDMMVGRNTDPHETAFTISVDYNGKGNTTGISAQDRANTIMALVDSTTKAEELNRPGHVFPLKAKNGGVLRRTGHTEAAIDLARLAGLAPAGVIVEIMNEDGTMARLPELFRISEKFGMKIISIEDLVAYRMEKESLIVRELEDKIQIGNQNYTLFVYCQTTTNDRHMAIVAGEWNENESVLVRVHASAMKGSILDSCKSLAGKHLAAALSKIEENGNGVIVYMQHQMQSENLDNISKNEGFDPLEKKINAGFKVDPRDFGIGAQILRDVGVSKMKIMTNSPQKRTGLLGYGLEVTEYVSLNGN